MKLKKRLFALALALVMAISLAACGGSGSGSAGGSASIPAPAGGGGSTSAAELIEFDLLPGKPYDGVTLHYLANSPGNDQFTMNQKWTEDYFTPLTGITVVWDQGPWDGVQQKMITESVNGSSTFDIFMVMDAWGPGVVEYLEPVNDFVARDGIDTSDFPAGYMEIAKMGDDSGSYYGLPNRGHFQAMYYRTDIYEALELEIPTTWAELEENSLAIQAEYPDVKGISFPYAVGMLQNMMPWYGMFYSYGAEFFDEDNMPVFNSPEGVAATEYYTHFVRDGLTPAESVAAGEDEAVRLFCEGKAAHFMNWSWLRSRFDDPEYTVEEVMGNVSTFPMPTYEGGQAVTVGMAFINAINSASENKGAAWEYIKFLSSAQMQREITLDTENEWGFKVNCITRKSVMNDPEVNALPDRVNMWEAGAVTLDACRIAPTLPEWSEVAALIEVAINNVANGADAKTELDAAAASARTIMEEAYG